ncbi:MAG: hypothetical protein U0Q21_05250 [Dermatophilaceae bacterium]
MRRHHAFATAILTVGTGVAGFAAPTSAAPVRVCTGRIAYQSVPVSISVPAGAKCTIESSTITGSITVGRKATLLLSFSNLSGVVSASGHAKVTIANATMNGLSLLQGGGVSVTGTYVYGPATISDNRGGVTLTYDYVMKALTCLRNDPAPTGGTITAGSKLGQCRRL